MAHHKNKSDNIPKLPSSLITIDAVDLDDYADKSARAYERIKTNQMRNIYGIIVRMKKDWEKEKDKVKGFAEIKRSLVLLKPKLAYTAARGSGELRTFKDQYTALINLVLKANNVEDQAKAVENFFDICEAVIAYHKFYSKQ